MELDIVVNFSDIDILSTTVKIILITSITTSTCHKDRPFLNTIDCHRILIIQFLYLLTISEWRWIISLR